MKRTGAFTTIIVAGLLAVAASPVGAVTLQTAAGQTPSGPWQSWADQARVPTAPVTVRFSTGYNVTPCGGESDEGCTDWLYGDALQPEISVQTCPAHVSKAQAAVVCDDDPRGTLYHELGHAYDAAVLTDAERVQFAAIWQIRLDPSEDLGVSWWQAQNRNLGAAAEWFAEAYRLCAEWPTDRLYHARHDWPSYGFPGAGTRIARDRLRASCRLIASSTRQSSQ